MKKLSKILYITMLCILCSATQHSAVAQSYNPEEYYTPDVEIINNLINDNGLQANLDDPEGWTFVVWDASLPKQVLEMNLANKGLTGYVSLTGLKTMHYLDCSNNDIISLGVTNCTQLNTLHCSNTSITSLFIGGTRIEFSGIVPFMLHKKEEGLYTCTSSSFIFHYSPTFLNPAISYETNGWAGEWFGILKSANTSVATAMFLIQNNEPFDSEYRTMYGYVTFIYSEEPETGISISDKDKLKMYLNPANNILIVENEESLPITTTVYNTLGSKVLTLASQGSAEINTSHLQNGVYIVTAVSEGKIIGSTKIIK